MRLTWWWSHRGFFFSFFFSFFFVFYAVGTGESGRGALTNCFQYAFSYHVFRSRWNTGPAKHITEILAHSRIITWVFAFVMAPSLSAVTLKRCPGISIPFSRLCFQKKKKKKKISFASFLHLFYLYFSVSSKLQVSALGLVGVPDSHSCSNLYPYTQEANGLRPFLFPFRSYLVLVLSNTKRLTAHAESLQPHGGDFFQPRQKVQWELDSRSHRQIC